MSSKALLFNNSRRAQGLKILCLSTMALGFFSLGATAWAQSNPVYSSQNATAQMEVRMQQMETQIRDLTGKIEEQAYDMSQLKRTIQTLEEQAAEKEKQAEKLGASQIAAPERELPRPILNTPENPLNLEYKPPEPAGMKTAIPGGEPLDATSEYEMAISNLRSQNYDEARAGFEKFLAENKDHVLAANAKYWLGETYYVQGEFKTAARTFAEGFQAYPDSAKSPDILLKLGMSLAGMGKNGDACVALSQLSIKFPTGHDPILARGQQEMDKLDCAS